jgi:hypothetical protein
MEPKKLLVVLALLVGAVLLPTAPAAASDAELVPRVVYPMHANNPRGTLVRVQIEGTADDWGVRQFAATMDARWPGLKVRTWGTCAQRPTWHCVKVINGVWDPAQQLELTKGQTQFLGLAAYPFPNVREIYLNSFYLTPEYSINTYAVAAHEFGHILGLNHHQQDGICGAVPDRTELGWAEDKALRPYYGKKLGKVRTEQRVQTPAFVE